ncbi:hypothetical protein EDEG_01427 [Edhazardia aedis USNM 41457]|uniref:Sulfhydryl oxidase n=1 Tax=Edhazardia aedis (strain USNM 41457) TaxID=1003232 RepID=J8ZX90_EDHAE|nr:hypothetical protein EDEG_01427 [Edhazardia aedis USNM 41457]|eukprot:EJW04303.1 hypothetical protein EDEG_01427 [Edhazardia aedis USNM 41457]
MRKETILIRIVICLVIFYLLILTFNQYNKRKYKQYFKGESMPSPYTSINPNVYSRKMTKLEIRENLGRSTWTLLHTLGAVYPGIPSANHKKDVLMFIHLLSKLYPCGDCAEHFQELLKNLPPKVDNHDEFALWLCTAHNTVNKRLGKAIFDCSKVDEVWECGCEGVE